MSMFRIMCQSVVSVAPLRAGALALLFVVALQWPLPSNAFSAQVHIPEKYTEVIAGERFYYELAVRIPESTKRQDLRIQYDIVKDGNVVTQAKFLKAIETQASFLDHVVIPVSANPGLHQLDVTISDYDDFATELSASFNVSSDSIPIVLYFYAIAALIAVIGAFIFREIHKLHLTYEK